MVGEPDLNVTIRLAFKRSCTCSGFRFGLRGRHYRDAAYRRDIPKVRVRRVPELLRLDAMETPYSVPSSSISVTLTLSDKAGRFADSMAPGQPDWSSRVRFG